MTWLINILCLYFYKYKNVENVFVPKMSNYAIRGLSGKSPAIVNTARIVCAILACNLAAKETGLECTCVNNDNLTILSGGSRCHWVSTCTVWASHSNAWVEQQICIKFSFKLEQSSTETIQVIQKASAAGNWWLAASSRQYTLSCIKSHAEIFGETSSHPCDSGP